MTPQLALLLAQYGTKILIGLGVILSLVAGYYYWKHEVSVVAHDKAISECNKSKEEFRIDAEHFKLARQDEVNKLNTEQSERVQNAIKTYMDHYDAQRNTAATSLRVKTNTASSCSNAMPGTDQGRSKITSGTTGIGEAELSPGTLRQLNQVIDVIDNQLKLKCEQLLNIVP